MDLEGGGGGGSSSTSTSNAINNNLLLEGQEGEGNRSGRHIALHPLAIVTICDHCTRVKVGGSLLHPTSRILGILFGVQDGLQVSITDAFELQYELSPAGDGSVRIPPGYVNEKRELFGAVHPGAEVMGWYSVGESILPGDLEIHRAMCEWNESPFFLLLSPAASSGGAGAGVAAGSVKEGELPVRLFESELHVSRGVPTMMFVRVPFRLSAAEAERISVEHVVKAAPMEGASSVDLHVDGVRTSLKALVLRVKTILKVLERLKEGGKEGGLKTEDWKLLRMVGSLCDSLPAAGREGERGVREWEESFLREYSDSLVVTYLASVSKLSCLTGEASEKCAVAFGEGWGGGGGGGGGRGGRIRRWRGGGEEG